MQLCSFILCGQSVAKIITILRSQLGYDTSLAFLHYQRLGHNNFDFQVPMSNFFSCLAGVLVKYTCQSGIILAIYC